MKTSAFIHTYHILTPKKKVQVVYRCCLQYMKGLEAGAVMFSADKDVDVLISAPIV